LDFTKMNGMNDERTVNCMHVDTYHTYKSWKLQVAQEQELFLKCPR